MTDVDHELGAIRFVVDAPLSSKVAMFNNVANQHKESQFLNPFSNSGSRLPPRRTFGKDEYGKPLAGSLTEMRGAKANIHVCKEMLELCQIINTEGFSVSENDQNLKVILFGDLFNIYTLISDKVVGLLLRARKYKLIDFEGEVLFQRRDDDVPIYMLKSIDEIKRILQEKQDEVRRSVSPSPQPTTVILDNLGRSASPAPRVEIPTREASPAPQNGLRRSASPALQQSNVTENVNAAQGNESRGSTPARQQNNLSRSVSPAPTQDINNIRRSASPAREQQNQTLGVSPASSLDQQNKSDSSESNEAGKPVVQEDINATSSMSIALKTNDSDCSQENRSPTSTPKIEASSLNLTSDNTHDQDNVKSNLTPTSQLDISSNSSEQ